MKIKILICALSISAVAQAEECRLVPVITGEFATETLFDPSKTTVKYESICDITNKNSVFQHDENPIKNWADDEKTTR